jgi:hypothetical protein
LLGASCFNCTPGDLVDRVADSWRARQDSNLRPSA